LIIPIKKMLLQKFQNLPEKMEILETILPYLYSSKIIRYYPFIKKWGSIFLKKEIIRMKKRRMIDKCVIKCV